MCIAQELDTEVQSWCADEITCSIYVHVMELKTSGVNASSVSVSSMGTSNGMHEKVCGWHVCTCYLEVCQVRSCTYDKCKKLQQVNMTHSFITVQCTSGD